MACKRQKVCPLSNPFYELSDVKRHNQWVVENSYGRQFIEISRTFQFATIENSFPRKPILKMHSTTLFTKDLTDDTNVLYLSCLVQPSPPFFRRHDTVSLLITLRQNLSFDCQNSFLKPSNSFTMPKWHMEVIVGLLFFFFSFRMVALT